MEPEALLIRVQYNAINGDIHKVPQSGIKKGIKNIGMLFLVFSYAVHKLFRNSMVLAILIPCCELQIVVTFWQETFSQATQVSARDVKFSKLCSTGISKIVI